MKDITKSFLGLATFAIVVVVLLATLIWFAVDWVVDLTANLSPTTVGPTIVNIEYLGVAEKSFYAVEIIRQGKDEVTFLDKDGVMYTLAGDFLIEYVED